MDKTGPRGIHRQYGGRLFHVERYSHPQQGLWLLAGFGSTEDGYEHDGIVYV